MSIHREELVPKQKLGKVVNYFIVKWFAEYNSLKSYKITEYRSLMDRYILTLLFERVRVIYIVSTFEYEDIVPSLPQQIVKFFKTLL